MARFATKLQATGPGRPGAKLRGHEPELKVAKIPNSLRRPPTSPAQTRASPNSILN
jgi:hypothetical protein